MFWFGKWECPPHCISRLIFAMSSMEKRGSECNVYYWGPKSTSRPRHARSFYCGMTVEGGWSLDVRNMESIMLKQVWQHKIQTASALRRLVRGFDYGWILLKFTELIGPGLGILDLAFICQNSENCVLQGVSNMVISHIVIYYRSLWENGDFL